MARNLKQDAAHRAVRDALRRGEIVRPSTCGRCGASPSPGKHGQPMIEAHHHDYDKPLEIEWLCKLCHYKETPRPPNHGLGEIDVDVALSSGDERLVLKAYRKRLGLSQGRLADGLGVSRVTLTRWETGALGIQHPGILRLALAQLAREMEGKNG